MSDKILILGDGDGFPEALIAAALDRGAVVATTTPYQFGSERVRQIARSGGSAIAARSMLRMAVAQLGAVDRAVLCLSVNRVAVPFHECPAVDIERISDTAFKFPIFLLKELIAYFLHRPLGRILAAVAPVSENDPLACCLHDGLHTLINRLERQYRTMSFAIQSVAVPQRYDSSFVESLVDMLMNERVTGKGRLAKRQRHQ